MITDWAWVTASPAKEIADKDQRGDLISACRAWMDGGRCGSLADNHSQRGLDLVSPDLLLKRRINARHTSAPPRNRSGPHSIGGSALYAKLDGPTPPHALLPLSPMAVSVQRAIALPFDPAPTRKRTTSFSVVYSPRKRLHRTESVGDIAFEPSKTAAPSVPYTRTLRFYKEQKERRRALVRAAVSASSCVDPPAPPTALPLPPARTNRTPIPLALPPARSPLARCESASVPPPARALLLVPHAARTRTTCGTGVPPGSGSASLLSPSSSRSSCSRVLLGTSSSSSSSLPNPKTSSKPKSSSKPPASLHRRALTAALRATPHGAKILHMGARLAVGILGATAELERICAGAGGCSEPVEGDEFGGEDEDEDEDGDADDMTEGAQDKEERLLDLDLELELEDVLAADADIDIDAVGEDEDEDVPMPDAPSPSFASPCPSSPTTANPQQQQHPVLSASWIVVVGDRDLSRDSKEREREEWEMVE
ncbi:hypothetical protein B0H11DRAFT_2184031 [Mycena galericulata]|nr:hypothetical protein B0H11DRAFT_2184031 [Mycena galericulata]